ncbi:MAG: hypothetical protein H6551_10265 [Chitinophagales bacterium]|nr:hypothetical protein [Chitinophagaceae bacterium]MCB9065511.1 hypothetical protein [Chitinophagales bacterium]
MRDTMLILHMIGLAMGLGTSFAFMFLGMAASKMDKDDAKKFTTNAMVVSRMGHIGITLLIISGGYLMTPFWSSLMDMPMLLTKLILVLVLIILIALLSINARKAKETQDDKYFKTIGVLGKFSMLTSLTIVILAVLNFH